MSSKSKNLDQISDLIGSLFVKAFHIIALFAIGAAIAWSGGQAYWGMVQKGHFSVEDILLLFIYLELAAMVGIYFKTSRLPVRFLIYVSITALTRLLIDIISISHGKVDMGIMLVSGAILVLTIASLIIRYSSYHMPLHTTLEEMSDAPSQGKKPE